ncbi:unnamed protein product [Effrenium voratum]|uniref:RNA helicase n=1 Tax=Effrenium voratum TaxID=2562239 RepID=A0AA36MWU3_9DINO|nr:unnamed protein product [Effrenium voratum]
MLANIFGRGRQRKAKTKTRHAKTTEVAEAAEENAAKKAKKKQIKIRNSEASEAKFAEAQDLARPKRALAGSKTSGAARRRLARAKVAQAEAEDVAEHEAEAPSQAPVSEVHVSGADLKPWATFEQLQSQLPKVVTSFMAKFKGFQEPSPIQAYCWPAACAGNHVVGISKTGSGKTLAFLLPALQRCLSFHSAATPSFGPYAVILAPTRELALQIGKDGAGLCRATRVKLQCLYGGTSKGEQIKSLSSTVDLIVATPGRLGDLATKPDKFTGQTILSLSMVHYVVLDEADCMLDLGFEHQVKSILEHVAEAFMPGTVHIKVGSPDADISSNHNVMQRVRLRGEKSVELKKLLRGHDKACIVFCALKKTAASLGQWLREEGFPAVALHGKLPQSERQEAMRRFRQGEASILVATDVAARGLDVKGVSLVVSYEPAVSLDAHVHRIGRTGRAGEQGTAYALLEAEDVSYAKILSESLRSTGQAVPPMVAELAERPVPEPPQQATKKGKQRAENGDQRAVHAAMCHLAVSKSSRAVSVLSRSHEIVLAYVLADLLDLPKEPLLLKFLSQSAEHAGRLDVAAEVLLQHPQGPSMQIPLLAARNGFPDSLRPYTATSRSEHQERASQCMAEEDMLQAVLHLACSRQDEQAVRIAVDALMALFGRPGGWTLAEARQLLEPLESLPVQDLGVKEIASTLACASFVGLVEASMLGYHELMFPLAQTLRNIITHQNLQFPVSLFEITLLEASSTAHRAPAHAQNQMVSLMGNPELPAHIRQACEGQVAAIEQRTAADEWPAGDGPGLLKLAGSHLPACYKKYAKASVLTNQLIRGPAFELEDRKNFVSLSDALAWVRVNAFSPLNTGCKIYPF